MAGAKKRRNDKGLAELLDREIDIAKDAEAARLRDELTAMRRKYDAALKQVDAAKAKADQIVGMQGIKAAKKLPSLKKSGRKNPATMMVLLSDIHCEEPVSLAETNGLNQFSLDICDQRLAELQSRFFTLLEHERHLADISRVVVWLGGDMISGHIHEELAEKSQLAPMPACRWIGARMRRFIDAVSDNADQVVVATSSGNHGRSTPKLRCQTELEHSFEQNLYLTMAAAETRKNVEWQVAEGELNYVDLDGFTVRFLHGFSIKYSGGVYGLALPAMKAISAWDASRRADLTCFGHYHSFGWLRGGRYVSNGSVMGHSSYTVRIKAGYEAPCQAAVVIDHSRNEVTKAMPIWCDRDLRGAS
jgi:hypothetical protein